MPIDKFIPLMIPDIQQQDIDAVVKVLQSGMLIQGAKVKELENNIAKHIGVKHAIAVSNGTASLHLALIALGIGKGDEVIVPALSYIATANVVELVGATPIFVDIDIKTFNINTNLIEAAITSKTKAILPVHEFGLACDITTVCELAKKHNLLVIEDAACALGAIEIGKFAGTFGNVGSFSFHPRKAVTSGEGGMLVTNDDELARKLRILRNHGIEILHGKMEFVEVGFNYRLTDFQAALVNSQFQRIESILNYKNQLSTIYFINLSKNKHLELPQVGIGKTHTWQSFHIVLEDNIDRDALIEKLKQTGIGVNYGAQCIPYQSFYKEKYNLDCIKLYPKALRAYQQGLVLPVYEKLNESDIEFVAEKLNNLTCND
ncbi:MAG: DegT/DnrJ/EryC1/StrS family aminotransferase [Ginsengibacter sp.]